MSNDEKGYFDYTAEEWVQNQHSDDELNDMADGEYERLEEFEQQDRDFICGYLELV